MVTILSSSFVVLIVLDKRLNVLLANIRFCNLIYIDLSVMFLQYFALFAFLAFCK